MNIIVVTSQPYANYHFNYFNEEQAAKLAHLVPDLEHVEGGSLVKTVTGFDKIDTADVLVIEGGDFSDWTKQAGFYANLKGIPVVLSEMAYNSSIPVDSNIPLLDGISACSNYGSFNYHSYLNDDVVDIMVTGHPMLDRLPEYEPVAGRVLVLSSGVNSDGGSVLKTCVHALEKGGHTVEVRPHPRDPDGFWDGFTVSKVKGLLDDVSAASVVVGVPGTGFIAAVALGVPTVAVEDSTVPDILPEYRYFFKYVEPVKVCAAVESVTVVAEKNRDFITGPVGGASDRLIKFWEDAGVNGVFNSGLQI